MEPQQASIIRRRRRRRRRREVFSSSDLLPESLWSEILYRVPVKSLFRFKSVSKAWLSIISDPLFARSYYSRTIIINEESTTNPPPWTILYRYGPDRNLAPEDLLLHVLKPRHPVFRSPSFTLRFLSDAGAGRNDQIDPLVVYGISNGLVLSTATRGWHDCYYISNPLTKQWSALPTPPRIHKWVSLGFIVEPTDGSFQVVRIGGYRGSSNVVKFEIFSSKTRQWKDKTASFNLLVRLFQTPEMSCYCHAVPCKKILHWMEYNGRIIAYDTSQTDDTGNDETIQCRLIDLPGNRVIDDKVTAGVIGVCQDHLRYCHCHAAYVTRNQILSVWELRKYNYEEEGEGEREGDWCLLYRIRLDEVNLSLSEFARPVAFHPLDPDTVYLHRNSKMLLASLNLRTRVCSNHVRLKSVINWWTVFAFVLPPWPTPIPQIS